jgi:amino-acid racemase
MAAPPDRATSGSASVPEVARSLKRLGLLGGMSWESSAVYYQLLNRMVHEQVGGHASAPVILWSVDFAEIEALQRAGDWDAQGRILGAAAAALQQAGVEGVALATNTLHLVADAITSRITVPFLDLIDVVGKAVSTHHTVGLLGTGYIMASDLYPSRLARFGVEVIVPDDADRRLVHDVIFNELVHGVVRPESRSAYLDVVDRLAARGADAVVLGCTEIGLLLADGDAAVPLLDTTRLHCEALSDFITAGAIT